MSEEIPLDDNLVVERDATPLRLAFLASVVSVSAFLWFSHEGEVLAYNDAVSHMEIARRVIDSPTSGFAQLGGVWLPLPHLLMVPFVWYDPYYYSGFAGSIVSMVAFVICSVLLYKIISNLTGSKAAGVIGAVFFMTNPNVLYMQSTPMTELLLFACLLTAVYYLVRWVETDDYQFLVIAGIACFFGSLTRYEAWILFAALCLVTLVVLWVRHGFSEQMEGTMLAFLSFGGLGVIAWAAWNQLLFGSPLYFQTGEYAKPSLWVSSSERAVNNLGVSAQTYWYAVVDNLGVVAVCLMVLGFVALVVRRRQEWLALLPVIGLLVFVPFFVLALYRGQRPLHVLQISGDLYNVRFGLLMVLPAAIAIGYLTHALLDAGKNRWFVLVPVACLLVASLGWTYVSSTPVTLQEADSFRTHANSADTEAADFMRQNYRRGKVLATFFGNERLLFDARIALRNNIYEGSYKLWRPALQDPGSRNITWIIMRKTTADPVFTELNETPQLQAYNLVFSNDTYDIYKRRS